MKSFFKFLWYLLLFLAAIAAFCLLVVLFICEVSRAWQIGVGVAVVAACGIYLLADHLKTSRNDTRERPLFPIVGALLFPDDQIEFTEFYKVYLKDKTRKPESPLDILFQFADLKKVVYIVDWKGEDDGETQEFLETYLRQKIAWTFTEKTKEGVDEETQHDGAFVITFLKALDKDLRKLKKKLLFFELGWDSYVFTCVDNQTFKAITTQLPNHFSGAVNLK